MKASAIMFGVAFGIILAVVLLVVGCVGCVGGLAAIGGSEQIQSAREEAAILVSVSEAVEPYGVESIEIDAAEAVVRLGWTGGPPEDATDAAMAAARAFEIASGRAATVYVDGEPGAG